jgi:N utilization substance protein B
MLNRRHLRIKVLQALYAYFQAKEDNFNNAEKELTRAVDKINDLYLFLLLSFSEIKSVAEEKIEDNKARKRATAEDLNPNLRFVENKLFLALDSSKELRRRAEEAKVSWIGDDNREMFKKVMNAIRENETYFAYINSEEEQTLALDLEFAITIFKEEIANSPLIFHFLEEKSIHWMDDIDLTCSMILKTLKSVKEDGSIDILPLFKDPEDEIPFLKTLFRKTISNDMENTAIIEELTKNWDIDRIAKMDILLMKMAITEFQEFNNIPTKVTLNEYIEISKFYSTPKSNAFINGILDNAIERLNKDNKINKIGRGLMS